jgi:PKD repeat protein
MDLILFYFLTKNRYDMKNIRMYFLWSLFIGLSVMSWAQTPINCNDPNQIVNLRNNLRAKFLLDVEPDTDDIDENVTIFEDPATIGQKIAALTGNNAIQMCSTSSSSWRRYLNRLQELAEAIACINSTACGYAIPSGSNFTQQDIIDALNNGLAYWYNAPCPGVPNNCPCATAFPCNDEWWWNHIGKQRYLQRIAVLAFNQILPAQRTNIINNLPDTPQDCDDTDDYTGANLADVASSMVVRALLRNVDCDEVEAGLEAMGDALAVNAEESIQEDFSFHQHGALLYNGGYGMALLEAITPTAAAIAPGSGFVLLNQERLIDFVLEGTRWMTVGNTTDHSANGREIARPHPGSNSAVPSEVMQCLIFMTENNPAFAIEHAELEEMNGAIPNSLQALTGNQYFWTSDYVVQYESNYMSSVRMSSPGTTGTENESDENLLGYWLPYGATFIYPQGDEYINIFPVWNWANIPGVTSPDIVPPLIDDDDDCPDLSTNDGNFVGSAGNGRYGVSAMEFNEGFKYGATCGTSGSVTAKKGWFHFGEEIIALGAGITGNGLDLHTTVNQCRSVGTEGFNDYGDTRAYTHDGIAYIFPNNQEPVPTNTQQQGSWNDINPGTCDDDPDTPADECLISATVFTLRLNHYGNTNFPEHNNSYYYIIAPGGVPADYDDDSNPITVLQNSPTIQAVKKEGNGDDLAGIIYYPDGFAITPIDLGNCLTMFTDKDCALLYDQQQGNITISSPDRSEPSIVLTIIRPHATDALIQLTFTIPITDDTVEPSQTLPIELTDNANCQSLAAFSYNQDNCVVNFTANTNDPALTHRWYRNNNQFAVVANPQIPGDLFWGAGTYSVTHEILFNGILIASATQDVTLVPGVFPTAAFTAPSTGCTNTQVSFTNDTQGTNTYSWNFGGNGTSTQEDPMHLFSPAGTYSVTLTATNNCGSDTEVKPITIYAPPTASFSAPTTGCTNSQISFTNTSPGATSYSWNFGDNATSALPNPMHTYSVAGNYTVTLTTTANGCTSLPFTQPITITPCGDASFSGVQNGCSSTITLTSTGNSQGYTHEWKVNNVVVSTLENPTITITSDNPSITHNLIPVSGGQNISVTQTIPAFVIDHPSNLGDLTINSSTTWDASNTEGPVRVIAANLIIQPGVTLTINANVTVMFCGSNSSLIIERNATTSTLNGGRLNLRGTLTDFQGQTWQGVEVRGTGTLPQNNKQGRLYTYINPNGTAPSSIRNAQVAIRNHNRLNPAQSGGVIQCEGATFVNNRRAAEFRRYPTNQAPTSNYNAKFKKCTFEVNNTIPAALSNFRSFIQLTQVRNVQIESSHFRNYMAPTPANPTILNWGVGIEAVAASFRVNSPTNVSIPGPVIPRCTFSGLGYGIWAYTKDTPTAPFVANLSDFNNCIVGIRNQGITGSTLLYNDFNMGTLPANTPNTFAQAGMVFEGRMDINACQENDFTNANAAATHPIVGINCHNIGYSENLIRRNTFNGMTTGNMAIGLNGNGDEFFPEGLSYLCNSNLNVAGFDIDVAQEDGTIALSSIRLTQGLGTGPAALAAGNIFSDPSTENPATGFFNSGSTISYLRDPNTINLGNFVPSVAPLLSVLSADGDQNPCPVVYCEPPCAPDGVINGLKTDYYAAKAALPQLQANYAAKPTEENAQALSQARQLKEYASRMVVLHTLYDTITFHPDTLFKWVRNRDNISAELWLSNIRLESGNITAALAILDDIPNKFSLSAAQVSDLQSYRNVTNLLAGQTIDNLNQSTLNALSSYDQSGGQTEAFAKRVLTLNGIHYAPEFVFSEASAGQNEDKRKEDLTGTKNFVTVAPNPAKDFVIFRFQLEAKTESAVLEVRDINGKILLSQTVQSEEEPLRWNTSGLPSGIYFYQLYTKTGSIQSGKVVLSK